MTSKKGRYYFDEHQLADFLKWFESLEFGIPHEVKLVRVGTGNWYSNSTGVQKTEEEGVYSHISLIHSLINSLWNENVKQYIGILIHSEGNKFSILSSKLEVERYLKNPRDSSWLPSIPVSSLLSS